MIICEIIVHLLVIVQNNKSWTVHVLKKLICQNLSQFERHRNFFCGTGNNTLRDLRVNSCHHGISSIIFMIVNKLFVEGYNFRLSWLQELLFNFWINYRDKVPAQVC